MSADIPRLKRLAAQLRKDAETFHGLHPAAMRSVAEIIETAIGAPIATETREKGAYVADDLFRGDPYARGVFNDGVRWAIEQMQLSPEEAEDPDLKDSAGSSA